MARNRSQFQKGLSEAGFASLCGTEDRCRAALALWRWPNGFVCPGAEEQTTTPSGRASSTNAILSAANFADGGHRLRLHEGSADHLVSRHVPDHANQAGYLLDRAWPPSRHDTDDRLESAPRPCGSPARGASSTVALRWTTPTSAESAAVQVQSRHSRQDTSWRRFKPMKKAGPAGSSSPAFWSIQFNGHR